VGCDVIRTGSCPDLLSDVIKESPAKNNEGQIYTMAKKEKGQNYNTKQKTEDKATQAITQFPFYKTNPHPVPVLQHKPLPSSRSTTQTPPSSRSTTQTPTQFPFYNTSHHPVPFYNTNPHPVSVPLVVQFLLLLLTIQ